MMDSDVDLLRISDTSNSVKQEFMFVGNHVTGPSWVVVVVVGRGETMGKDAAGSTPRFFPDLNDNR